MGKPAILPGPSGAAPGRSRAAPIIPSMLFLLSPAKSLDYDSPLPEGLPATQPVFEGPRGPSNTGWVAGTPSTGVSKSSDLAGESRKSIGGLSPAGSAGAGR